MKSIFDLREVSRAYPPHVVRISVSSALRAVISDAAERSELAAIVAAWLTDQELSSDPPPLSARAVDQIWRDLLRRAH
jgi:hypothetical protein